VWFLLLLQIDCILISELSDADDDEEEEEEEDGDQDAVYL